MTAEKSQLPTLIRDIIGKKQKWCSVSEKVHNQVAVRNSSEWN